MSVNWDWNAKKGEVIWKGVKKNPKVGVKLKWNIYHANCLCAIIREFKEDGKDMYQFITWFSDIEHLKNVLGLTKKYKDNIFKDYLHKDYWKLEKVRLDISYDDSIKMAKYIAQSGIKVELYKGKA